MLSQDKNMNKKGFLLIVTLFLVTFILGSFLAGYRTIYSKGQKIISAANKFKLDEKIANIHSLTYNEFYKIDKEINTGAYLSSLDFFAGSDENYRIWLNQKKSDEVSRGGYFIKKIFLNKKMIYEAGTGNCWEIMNEFLNKGNIETIFNMELEKKIDSRVVKLTFTASIILKYKYQNTDITKPDAEYIEEFWAYAEE